MIRTERKQTKARKLKIITVTELPFEQLQEVTNNIFEIESKAEVKEILEK